LARDRDQLWAESVERFRSGAAWWLDSVELNRAAQGEQADRYQADPWSGLIAAWIEQPVQRYDGDGHPLTPFTSTPESVTVPDILIHCVAKRQDLWTQQDQNRVARSLRSLGWERHRRRTGTGLEWRYRRHDP